MNRIHIKFIKWLSNKFGYKIAMLKAAKGATTIEGDKELLRYVDITGYLFLQEPLKRTFNDKNAYNRELEVLYEIQKQIIIK